MFTHLQVRSGYSFYQSTMTIETLVKQAANQQYHTLALTDEAVLHGSISFYKTCINHGIKPIIGMIVNVETEQDGQSFSCVLLAKSNTGYRHLMAISTSIQVERACTLSLLQAYGKDIIC